MLKKSTISLYCVNSVNSFNFDNGRGLLKCRTNKLFQIKSNKDALNASSVPCLP